MSFEENFETYIPYKEPKTTGAEKAKLDRAKRVVAGLQVPGVNPVEDQLMRYIAYIRGELEHQPEKRQQLEKLLEDHEIMLAQVRAGENMVHPDYKLD
jgi:hypothetical protein